jgi:hypothetical protein
MPTKNECNERVSFTPGTWVSMMGMVGTGVATNLMLIYGLSGSLQDRIDTLDVRWQERMASISRDWKTDMQHLESRIPPDWFRRMVEANTDDIERLENEFTRDFVRKDELRDILQRDTD